MFFDAQMDVQVLQPNGTLTKRVQATDTQHAIGYTLTKHLLHMTGIDTTNTSHAFKVSLESILKGTAPNRKNKTQLLIAGCLGPRPMEK